MIAAAYLISFNAICYAQQNINQEFNSVVSEDSSKAPHGGTLKIADTYFIELVLNDSKVVYYIYDLNIKPISNKGIKGKAIFQFQNKSTVTISLITQGLNGFSTGNRNLSNYTMCQAIFIKAGKVSKVEFIKPIFNAIKYTCALHPEIIRDKPGNCPKCGMALIEKKEMAKKNLNIQTE